MSFNRRDAIGLIRALRYTCFLIVVMLPLFATALQAQHAPTLYITVLETKGYVVGARNAASGVFRHDRDTTWTHLGWRNIRANGIDATPDGTLFLAAGNGVFRSRDRGGFWRQLTGWEITEVQDLAVDVRAPEHVYIATAYGAYRSTDGGETWEKSSSGISNPPFLQAAEADARQAGRVIVAGEGGLFLSEDFGVQWRPVGPSDVPVRDVHQSAADPDLWLAGTQDRGVLISEDAGETWRFVDGIEKTIYAVALDPTNAARMAAGGYESGVYVSTDGGKRWELAQGLRDHGFHAMLFDVTTEGRLWAGSIGSGVFFSDDLGASWTDVGLPGAVVWDMDFVGGGEEEEEGEEEGEEEEEEEEEGDL